MYISSMTGFARTGGTFRIRETDYSWFWEVKSVNGKYLEVKTKLPVWLDGMSQSVKNLAGEYLSRGNVYASLEITASNSEPELKINEQLLQKIIRQAVMMYQENPELMQKPNPAELLGIRGVAELEENRLDEREMAELQSEILETFAQAGEALQQDRQAEGEKITAALREIIFKIIEVVVRAEQIADAMPVRLKEKLQQQVALLLEPSNQISEERLAQEVVLYVTKADIREEIDRLKAHIKTAGELLNGGGAVGRRLDFLCQELNRETNTVCSKSGDIGLTNCGMELKALIEQFREQVQNIE